MTSAALRTWDPEQNRKLPAPYGRCPVCEGPMPRPKAGRGRKPKFCSPRCKQYAHRRGGKIDGRVIYGR